MLRVLAAGFRNVSSADSVHELEPSMLGKCVVAHSADGTNSCCRSSNSAAVAAPSWKQTYYVVHSEYLQTIGNQPSHNCTALHCSSLAPRTKIPEDAAMAQMLSVKPYQLLSIWAFRHEDQHQTRGFEPGHSAGVAKRCRSSCISAAFMEACCCWLPAFYKVIS